MAEETKTPAAGSSEQAGGAASGTTADKPSGESGASGGGAPDPSKTGQPSSAADPGFEIDWQGKKVKLTRELATEAYGKHLDYTKKMQDLASQRKSLEAGYNERLKQEIARQRQEWEKSQREKEDPPSPEEATSRRLADIEAKMQDERLDRALQSVMSKHQGVNEKMLLLETMERFGQNMTEKNLEEVASEMADGLKSQRETMLDELLKDLKHPKIAAMRQAAIDEYLQNKLKDGERKHETGGSGGPGGGNGNRKVPANLDEAEALSRQMLDEASRG